MDAELPEMRERLFKCPNCSQDTLVATPMNFIFAKWVTCDECGKEFFIDNNVPRR